MFHFARGITRIQDADDLTGPLVSGTFLYWSGTAFVPTAAVTYATSGTLLTVTAQAISDVPLTLTGASGQTGNLLNLKNSGGTVLVTVGATGTFYASTLSAFGAGGIATLGLGSNGVHNFTGALLQDARSFAWQMNLAGDTSVLTMGSGYQVTWRSSTFATQGSADTGLARKSAAVIALTDGSTGAGALSVPTPASGAGLSLVLSGSAAASGNTNGGNVLVQLAAKSGAGNDGKFIVKAATASPGDNQVEFQDSSGTKQAWLNSVWKLLTNQDIIAWSGAATQVTIGYTNALPGVAFGLSNDTSLYKAAAGVIAVASPAGVAAGLSSPARSPTQLAADTNNYSPGVGLFQRWSSDASRNVTGLVAGQDGETRYVWNVGSQNIVLVNESASSTNTNRFTTATGADLTLAANKCALVMYDLTTARWRVTLLP